MQPLLDKPIIEYVVEAPEQITVEKIGIVVGEHNKRPLQELLGGRVDYILQQEQLGTGMPC